MSIDLSQPAGAFTGPHIQGTDDDVSKPIVNVVNPPANPTAASIFDLLKHADRKMIFRDKSEDGTSSSPPGVPVHTGTATTSRTMGSRSAGVYDMGNHRNTAEEDSDGKCPVRVRFKTVMYAFDLEELHELPVVRVREQAGKLQGGDFLDASDLNHEAGSGTQVSPLTQANAFASYEIYECTSTNGATVEPTPSGRRQQRGCAATFDGANIGDVVAANADKAFAADIKVELDKAASKEAIGYDTLAIKTKDVLSIDAVESARPYDLRVQNEANTRKRHCRARRSRPRQPWTCLARERHTGEQRDGAFPDHRVQGRPDRHRGDGSHPDGHLGKQGVRDQRPPQHPDFDLGQHRVPGGEQHHRGAVYHPDRGPTLGGAEDHLDRRRRQQRARRQDLQRPDGRDHPPKRECLRDRTGRRVASDDLHPEPGEPVERGSRSDPSRWRVDDVGFERRLVLRGATTDDVFHRRVRFGKSDTDNMWWGARYYYTGQRGWNKIFRTQLTVDGTEMDDIPTSVRR